ncbi:uncharacterized protein LOC18448933 isoform X2 [Amborella trichopoda]|uniref:uncharacterized protein LOC18448933 isoform X2 n=1 Tax=Amborella trichopoda TaxID=13333 RepID=UPI0009BEC75A|nr:uncharacterized protein LOC18448933 isoform X2 [Amborella trichopoda]|eukprot:XP_020532053.1 uncharacterized protein LOC18448933 isoform X2 [Amborella trichopoda]
MSLYQVICPPPKPWERMQSSAGLSPFKPPAPGRTADVVAASGTAKPGVPVAQWNPVMNGNPAGRPQPSRAWEQNRNNCEYGANMNYNPGYGPPSPPSFWIFVLRVILIAQGYCMLSLRGLYLGCSGLEQNQVSSFNLDPREHSLASMLKETTLLEQQNSTPTIKHLKVFGKITRNEVDFEISFLAAVGGGLRSKNLSVKYGSIQCLSTR